MKHFLVYQTDEAGNGFRGDPLFLLSFEDDEIPSGVLEEGSFLRQAAASRVGHNFVNTKPVTVASLEQSFERLNANANLMHHFLAEAELNEGID